MYTEEFLLEFIMCSKYITVIDNCIKICVIQSLAVELIQFSLGTTDLTMYLLYYGY